MSDEIHIIEDGAGPDNFERGDKALHATAFYMRGGQLEGIVAEEVLEIGDNAVELFGARLPEGSPIPYLIADLCHLLRRYGFDIDGTLDHAVAHFASDVIEQAWRHNEDWAAQLQDESNVERAITVMQAAGVPERVFEHALRLTGLRSGEETA